MKQPKHFLVLFLIAFLGVCSMTPLPAQTGADFLEMTESEQRAFIAGVREGVNATIYLLSDASEDIYNRLIQSKYTIDQIIAYLKAGLERYPANREYVIGYLIYILDALMQPGISIDESRAPQKEPQ